MAKKPAPKKRAEDYEEKLKLNGTFSEALKSLVKPKRPLKKK